MRLLRSKVKLQNKRVVITGGANGLGLELARLFAQAGSVLVLTDIDTDGLARAERELRRIAPAVHTFQVDVADSAQVNAMAKDVLDSLGGVDILINNAGISHLGELVETSMSTWRRLMDVNFWGPLQVTEAFMPAMARAGNAQIVNIASGQVFYRLPTWGPYTAVKSALATYSEMLTLEVRKLGIFVTTVHPFIMNTKGFFEGMEGETWGARLSLKLSPHVAMSPTRVAHIIVNATRRRKPVEMVTPMNWLSYYARFVPGALDLANRVTFRLLGKSREQLLEQLAERQGAGRDGVTDINAATQR